ncbi:MAG TPA: hypothetical protein RMH85_25355 [Polyangiaceae bacterium LLY-WYZ-15_(1-7)]|nr:hypothetical protein [Sandaracinus sp.]HJL04395.1 hypothetical protein [Polyangiaceae bacterium LLY-WYZ-15_(1-7)]MBJ70709.1 hypothetical protein [Sandaracinus sp.]HJL11828.1 hypothetical protein [Polyangiaceae bacterium LLY-WYZ-15_(1-7)]HJL23964.1 hypothetical protein [Polyangiaceae bacterium LLY-WYZ-15_(1-7)]
MQHLALFAALSALALGCASGADRRGRITPDAGTRDSGVLGGGDTGPGAPDSGLGAPDTGPTVRPDTGPPRACSTNVDCDDGLACNGAELCVGGTCQAGTALACDDGVACTTDACAEPAGSCTHTPNDALCPAGQVCGASGCETGGGSCSESPCKVVAPQCGCATGQGCYIDADGDAGCSDTVGTVGEGGACTAIADCQPGLTCIGLGGSTAACHRLCDGDADCSSGSFCILGLEDSAGAPLSVRACTIPCDPAAQTGCPAGAHCFLGSESEGAMRDITHCEGEPAGTTGQGGRCVDQTDCRAGFVCLDPDGFGNQCLAICRNPSTVAPGPSADCGTFEDCYGFDPAISVGATRYGVCWNGF